MYYKTIQSTLLFFALFCASSQEWNSIPFEQPTNSNVVVFIGATFPFFGGWPVGRLVQPAFDLALREINANSSNIQFVGIWGDSKCSPSYGPSNFVSLKKDHNVQIVVGDGCSLACEPMAYLGGVWKAPQLSWGCSSPILSDKSRFPYFVRTSISENSKIDFMIKLFQHFGWRRFATISADIPLTSAFMEDFTIRAKEEGIHSELSEVHKIDQIPRIQMERIQSKGVRLGGVLFICICS